METNQEIIFKKRTGISFKDFYKKYRQKLEWHISQTVFNKNIVEDIATETFMLSLNNIEAFDINKAKLNTWLYNIANNTIKSEYAIRSRSNEVSFDDVVCEGVTYENFITTHDNGIEERENNKIREVKLNLIKEAIFAISDKDEKCKEILIMREIENLKYTEISNYYGIGMSDVKNNLRKGRRLVQERVIPLFKEMRLN